MNTSIFALTPHWIMFDQFWVALKKRNLWLIKLRYGAVIGLAALVTAAFLLPTLDGSFGAVSCIAAGMLIYNAILHHFWKRVPPVFARFHGLHFALIQIAADFLALACLIYVTGGVESPFFYFFIFHIILGSLILPSAVVSLFITVTILVMFTGALLELQHAIPHYPIQGFLDLPLYEHGGYVAGVFIAISFMLYVSNYLANSISKELYMRERALMGAYDQLKEAERAKSRYVMSIVHDLKTPIAAAATYVNLILEKGFGPVAEEFLHPLERVRLRLGNAIAVINDILEFAQVKLAEHLHIEDVRIGDLIDGIYQDMRILFKSRNIRFTKSMDGGHDITVRAEPRLLQLALSNLISNAWKYTDPGGNAEVRVRDIGDEVSIEIADDGIGIPAAEQEKVFEDFYRTGISKQKSTEGTGLGLSLVKHIMTQLRGSITLVSPSSIGNGADRPGTSFILTLPKRPSGEQEGSKPENGNAAHDTTH